MGARQRDEPVASRRSDRDRTQRQRQRQATGAPCTCHPSRGGGAMKTSRLRFTASSISLLAMVGVLAFATPVRATGKVNDAEVKRALEDEMARSLKDLKLGSEAPPYFLRYVVSDSDRYWVSARLGALVDEDKQPSRAFHIEMRVGSPDDDNTNFMGSSPGGSATVSREDDYDVMRRDLWQLNDREYKQALESFARKKASKAVQTADKDKTPDFSKAPTVNVVKNIAVVPSDADRA